MAKFVFLMCLSIQKWRIALTKKKEINVGIKSCSDFWHFIIHKRHAIKLTDYEGFYRHFWCGGGAQKKFCLICVFKSLKELTCDLCNNLWTFFFAR